MKIFIASDHTGFEVKKQIINHFKNNYEFIDDGPLTPVLKDEYPERAFTVAEHVANNHNSLGILICGTGFGMCIAANKIKGIRAINICREDMAKLAKEHNNANIITLSARFVSINDNIKIVKAFLDALFTEQRHQERINRITDYENGTKKK